MILLTAISVGVIAFVVILTSTDIIIQKAQVYLITKQFSPRKSNKDVQILLGAIIGFIAGVLLTTGTNYMTTISLASAGMGAGAVEISYRILTKRKEDRRRQECFLLFEAIEIFIQSGYSIPQALAIARDFTPSLTPEINKTLAAWPQGAVKALEVFRDSIDLPEGDQLVSLLLQINQAGSKNLGNIIQAEARQMEEKRKAMEKARITQKPVFLMAYRLLPLVVLMGMLAGVLVNRVFAQMSSMF